MKAHKEFGWSFFSISYHTKSYWKRIYLFIYFQWTRHVTNQCSPPRRTRWRSLGLAWGMAPNFFGRGRLQLVQLGLVRVVSRFEATSDEALWGDERLARVLLFTICPCACWAGPHDIVQGSSWALVVRVPYNARASPCLGTDKLGLSFKLRLATPFAIMYSPKCITERKGPRREFISFDWLEKRCALT